MKVIINFSISTARSLPWTWIHFKRLPHLQNRSITCFLLWPCRRFKMQNFLSLPPWCLSAISQQVYWLENPDLCKENEEYLSQFVLLFNEFKLAEGWMLMIMKIYYAGKSFWFHCGFEMVYECLRKNYEVSQCFIIFVSENLRSNNNFIHLCQSRTHEQVFKHLFHIIGNHICRITVIAS